MQKSMTAFAVGKIKIGELTYQVALTSVNRKAFDLQIILPDALTHFSSSIRSLLQKLGGRGAIICKVTPLDIWEDSDLIKVVKARHTKLVQIAATLGYNAGDVTFDLLLQDLDKTKKIEISSEIDVQAWDAIFQNWDQEREREGLLIEKELETRALHICTLRQKIIEKIEETTPFIAQEMATLAARYIEEASVGVIEKHQYLAAAMTLLEKNDPAEEIARLDFHMQSFLKRLKNEPESGKFLELLLTECQREASTLSAKVRSSLLSAMAVEIKYEIEKMKEQVLNLV